MSCGRLLQKKQQVEELVQKNGFSLVNQKRFDAKHSVNENYTQYTFAVNPLGSTNPEIPVRTRHG